MGCGRGLCERALGQGEVADVEGHEGCEGGRGVGEEKGAPPPGNLGRRRPSQRRERTVRFRAD